MQISLSVRDARFCLILAAITAFCTDAFCTSPQIESSEPVFNGRPGLVHATAFFGAVPGSDVYDTAGSLGATFQLGKAGSGRFYFFGDIFTWVDNSSGGNFDPKRVIYTLEPGYTIANQRSRARLFIKHQSFHDVDGFDNVDESYELYGASYQWLGEPDVYVSAGKYLNRKDIAYDWDMAASATFSLVPLRGNDTYFRVWLHHVTEDDNPDRDGFTDYAGELGVWLNENVVVFGRYQLLNDIDRFNGTSDRHVMTGVRYSW